MPRSPRTPAPPRHALGHPKRFADTRQRRPARDRRPVGPRRVRGVRGRPPQLRLRAASDDVRVHLPHWTVAPAPLPLALLYRRPRRRGPPRPSGPDTARAASPQATKSFRAPRGTTSTPPEGASSKHRPRPSPSGPARGRRRASGRTAGTGARRAGPDRPRLLPAPERTEQQGVSRRTPGPQTGGAETRTRAWGRGGALRRDPLKGPAAPHHPLRPRTGEGPDRSGPRELSRAVRAIPPRPRRLHLCARTGRPRGTPGGDYPGDTARASPASTREPGRALPGHTNDSPLV